MRFLICRTSRADAFHLDSIVPQGVTREERTQTERYLLSGLPPGYARGLWWTGKGKNHREEDGVALREVTRAEWWLTTDDLATLAGFCKSVGSVIVEVQSDNEATLEIYDDYRE